MNDRAPSHRAGHPAPAFAPAIGLREVLEASPDFVFCCDAWGRFAWVSASFEHLAGWRASELVGQPFTKVVAPSDRIGAVRAFARQRRRSSPVVDRRLAMARAEGGDLPISVKVRLYERPDGDAYFVGVAREAAPQMASAAPAAFAPSVTDADAQEALAAATAAIDGATTAATTAEERAKALQSRLEEVTSQSQMKSEFLATLSHEVRTPVEGVIERAHRLLQNGLDPVQRQAVDEILRASQTLIGLVSEALDYGHPEAGSLAPSVIDFDLRNALTQVDAGLDTWAGEHRATFVSRISTVVPSRLKGDPGKLRQVLMTLGQHLLKANDGGRIALNVERAREDDTHVAVHFRFESGSSAEGAPSDPAVGPALALAIARRLVERMGGRLDAENAIGRGGSCGFQLVFEKQPHAVAAPAPAEVQLRGLRMLVADSSDAERRTTTELLGAWGVAVDSAGNGLEALEMVRNAAAEGRPYAVAVVDMQMDGLDGEAVGSAVRADSDLDGTLLMLTTRVGRPGDAARMKEMGFSAYLVKPLEVSQLFDAIAEVVATAQSSVPPAQRTLVTRHSLAEARRGRLRILLVEDDVVNQLVTQSALNRVGYNVEIASNGRAAIELTEDQHWDLILMDTQMPGLDGYRATEAIRARERGSQRTPILGLTGDSSFSTDREKCLASGMDEVFRKPIDLAELTTAVERWTLRGDARGPEALEPARGHAHAHVFSVVSGSFDPPADAHAHESGAEPSAAESLVEALDRPEGPAIDLEQLNTASMGLPALRTSLLHTYLDDVYPRLERLAQAIEAQDAHRVEFEAHGLRGMCATIGATACMSLFGEIESAARDGHVADSVRWLGPARQAVQRTEEFIHRLERIVTQDAA